MTRRSILQSFILGDLLRTRESFALSAAQQSPLPPFFRPFTSWGEALDSPCSRFFGITAIGAWKDRASLYSAQSEQPGEHPVSFDVSNERILCSITREGLFDRACILTGIVPVKHASSLPGTFVDKRLVRGGPWPWRLRTDGAGEVSLDKLPATRAELLGNFFPLFTSRQKSLRLRLLAFAPFDVSNAALSPRAVIAVAEVANNGRETSKGTLLIPAPAGEREMVLLLDESAAPSSREVGFELKPGERKQVAIGIILGEDAKELSETAAVLKRLSSLQWLNVTREFHNTRKGRLLIPEAAIYSESVVRMAALCRRSVMRLRDGSFGGGFLGSDVEKRTVVWNRDTFYGMLPMSMLFPQLCADSISFFLKWGTPPKPFGRGVARFPKAGRVTHSLVNALSPLVLSGAYYQMTADREFFRARPEILSGAKKLLQEVLESRQDKDVWLFPSMYISDGDARGDYHTGSNVIAWNAFRQMARIAREVYSDPNTAANWESVATRVKEDIWRRCCGSGPSGKQFFEGVWKSGTPVAGHDGDESDTTLMPFYGFCEPDEPALLNHARAALTPDNPYYARGVDGIWWQDEKWFPATFPGWTTALAGAKTSSSLMDRLEKIRSLTDADGSVWRWPYPYGTTDPAAARRDGGKCSWAAGVYLCLFLHNVLGIGLDMPARTVALRPFTPWRNFYWDRCRIGSGEFDFISEERRGVIAGSIMNRNQVAFDGLIELTLRAGAKVVSCALNGKPTKEFVQSTRYERPSVRVRGTIPPGRRLRLEVMASGGE